MREQDRPAKKRCPGLLLRLLAYLLLVAAITYTVYSSPFNPHPQSVEDIRRWVAGFGTLAPLLYVAVYTVRPLLLVPALLLNLSAGILFGPWQGSCLLLLGGLGCACFCYGAGRFGGGSWLLAHFGGSWGRRLSDALLLEHSFVKMLWLRTVPLFPYDPVSIFAGSAGMPLKVYLAATALGMLPGALAYNFFAASLGTGELYPGVILLLLAFGVPLLCWLRRADNHMQEGRGRWWERIWK